MNKMYRTILGMYGTGVELERLPYLTNPPIRFSRMQKVKDNLQCLTLEGAGTLYF